jgi:hypothetical protein
MAPSSDELDQEYNWGGDGSDLHEPVRAHAEAALVPTDAPYPPPLDQLLELGDLYGNSDAEARIAALGLTQEHVADLVRMARDRALHTTLDDTDASWAPIHALIALKNLDFEAVAGELVPLFDVDSEIFDDRLIDLLAGGGASTLEALGSYLNDRARWVYGRTRAADAIGQLVERRPELRDRAVELLSAALERATENDVVVNGFVLGELLDLDAVEALPVIRQAFEQDAIDETIAGDWGDVLEELGQTPDPADELIARSHKLHEERRASMFGVGAPVPRPAAAPPAVPRAAPRKSKANKQKAKRKMSKASRKANVGKKKKRR